MSNDDRQSGATAAQMKDAPRDAIYIWVNNKLAYPRALARLLGREDLDIRSPVFFETDARFGHRGAIVIDHATRLTPRQAEGWAQWRSRFGK
jgi:hypothetical protein